MNAKFLEFVKQKVVLFDGGMGTELYKRGIFINKCFDELNLTNPEIVKQVHKEYLQAGCDVIETNTFGANLPKLSAHQLSDKLYDINYYGAKLAREIASDKLLVAGAIGPLGIQIEPLGPTSNEEVRAMFIQQLRGLIDGAVDLLIFETFIYPNELQQAIIAAKSICNLPIIAQMTIDEDGRSLTGANPKFLVKELEATQADVIGINCTAGPQTMLNWLEEVREFTSKPISIMPNAGKPKSVDGRNIYLTSPEYMAEFAKHLINSGANVIGGCCGTGPKHIKAMRTAIKALVPQFSITKSDAVIGSISNKVEPIKKENKSRLARQVSEGKFVKFVELLSPYGVSADKELEKAKELYFSGIDVINIPDGPRASSRMSALALAVQIQKEVGIETVLHYVCRDRNVIGIQSDLLGAAALGIRNILAITGDPPKLGTYPDATGVFDVDSIGLVNILKRLNDGMDIAGNPIGKPTGFFIGVGANPGAINLEKELSRLFWKIDAGAEYIITQPVFDVEVFLNFYDKIKNYNLPLLAGLWPLASYRNAEFMNNEIPGCSVPKQILKRLKAIQNNKEESILTGIQIASEILEQIRPYINGVQISVPFGRIQSAKELINDK